MRAVIGVSALPISICPQATSWARPSSATDLVKPVTACLVAVYGAEKGRGVWAETDPLLMMRPPRGSWRFMIRSASRVQRNMPVRLTSTTLCHCSRERSSSGAGGTLPPALLKSTSKRPKRSAIAPNAASTAASSVTSDGGIRQRSGTFERSAVSSSADLRRPSRATPYPSSSMARAAWRPTPLPAPVTAATRLESEFMSAMDLRFNEDTRTL